jgi:Coenzyme PQQ synthesis protein D (PqqD)
VGRNTIRHVKPSPNVVFQEVEGETVLLDLESEHYFSLDEVGARVWALLGEHDGNVEAIVAAMLAEFDVDEQTLRRDVDALIAQLRSAGLVVAA